MPVWLTDNSDYILFVLACLTLFGALEAWLRLRSPKGRLFWLAWPTLAILLLTGCFLVEQSGRSESRKIQDFLQGVAPTYAEEISRMGHADLRMDTPADDPGYLRMIEATKRWKAVNPAISDVYTYRVIDGVVHFMVVSEADYNRDGKFEGKREQRLPLGEVYAQADSDMVRVVEDGVRTFSEMPVRDEWGMWVSAQVPLRDKGGRIEGALGVDYPAEKWVSAIAAGRQRMIWLLSVPILILAFAMTTTGALRAEIGARKRVEKQLRESEAHLLTALDSIPFDFWIMDEQGRYLLVNAASRDQLGQVVGKTLTEIELPPDTRAIWEANNRRAFGGEIVRGEVALIVHGQSRIFHNVVAPVRVGGKILGILGLNIDLTERLNAEAALRKSEQRLAMHVRNTPLAVMEWDTEFRVRAWNPAAEKIFGFKAEEVMGLDVGSLIIPPKNRDLTAKLYADLLAQRGGYRNTNENLTKDGRVILCDWYNAPLVDAEGRMIGVASHCEDITERDVMDRHLRQTQKIESLGQLAAGVAHEFNNLLTPMLLRLEMLRYDRANDPALLTALRSIEDAIHQAAQLNQRILAVGRRSVEKREMLTINPVIDDTLTLLRHTLDRRIEMKVNLSPGMGPLLMDRAQFAQVVVNLTLNARDAVTEKYPLEGGVSPGPCIEVSTCVVEAAPPAQDGGSGFPIIRKCQRLTIADNGPGMDAKVKAHVFEPFYTTKSVGQGTGLGLSVVWNVVKSLDGWIEVDSQPGEGAAFHVFFPVPDVIAPTTGATSPLVAGGHAPGVPAKLRILLVDDNVFVADTINRLLTRAGHAVTYAQNGEEAWTSYAGSPDAFDLVMTDQNMPVMTGAELLRRLRGSGSAIRVLVVSGHVSTDLRKELKALGVNGVLTKPFTQNELFAAVDAALSDRPA
jgi:two-component system, cell cycle sensor histidine kinase and response regulator CckA